LVQNYQKINQEIVELVRKKDVESLSKFKSQKVADFLPKDLFCASLKLSEIDLVIQRLEPMKEPFPPVGEENIDEFLTGLKKAFPKVLFNCPINLCDKEITQEINLILDEKIATPTAEFELEENAILAIQLMSKEYQNIYGNKDVKLVLKPKNSAQSLGVFAVNFVENGWDLQAIKLQNSQDLRSAQRYKIKPNLDEKELQKVIEILCFVQNFKGDEVIQNLPHDQILKAAKSLYNGKILVQPFLEGIKSGDVRVNFFKDADGNFYKAGQVFRKSLRNNEENFTTAYSTGGAIPQPIEILEAAEIANLSLKVEKILKILNGDLRQKYRDSIELGADFILVGNGADIFLGEINHHCQGLIPLGETMEKAMNDDAFYKGGLGLSSSALKDLILMQKLMKK
jgi:hypothetical protein